MLWDNLYVAGFGAYLPERIETADQAVAEGKYTETESFANAIRSVCVADPDTEAPPVMAAAAGRQAVERAGIPHEAYDLVVHAGMGHQGLDFWQPASYVQDNTVGGAGNAVEIKQGSNGGLAAFDLAASWVVSRPGTAALVTVADSFHLPYFDRWRSEDQQVYGDGAGAAVLCTGGGFARVLSTASVGDSTLEPLTRGEDRWTIAPFNGEKVDLVARKRAFLSADGRSYDGTIMRMRNGMMAAIDRVFKDTGLDMESMAYFIHANTGKGLVEYALYPPLGWDVSRTVYEWGRGIGHIGAADHLVNLEYLVRSGKGKAGDKILALGVSHGFVWTAVLLELLETPAW